MFGAGYKMQKKKPKRKMKRPFGKGPKMPQQGKAQSCGSPQAEDEQASQEEYGESDA